MVGVRMTEYKPQPEVITVGGHAVATRNPDTGAYTHAVRVNEPGQPVGSCKPLNNDWHA